MNSPATPEVSDCHQREASDQHTRAALYAFVGQRRKSNVPAQLLQRLALAGCAAHGGVQNET